MQIRPFFAKTVDNSLKISSLPVAHPYPIPGWVTPLPLLLPPPPPPYGSHLRPHALLAAWDRYTNMVSWDKNNAFYRSENHKGCNKMTKTTIIFHLWLFIHSEHYFFFIIWIYVSKRRDIPSEPLCGPCMAVVWKERTFSFIYIMKRRFGEVRRIVNLLSTDLLTFLSWLPRQPAWNNITASI